MGRPTRHIDTDVEKFFSKPGIKVLDLCCCSGLATEGIQRHGVNVLGVDIVKPSYYPGTFMQADVTKLELTFVQLFNFGWGSPPCQFISRGGAYARQQGTAYVNILPETIHLLKSSGIPSIVENIPEAGLYPHFMLCGSMFGLPMLRHRYFEAFNWVPEYTRLQCNHAINKGSNHVIAGSFRGTIHDAARSMDCYPTRLRSEIKEGIPPAYSEFIFGSFLKQFNMSPGR